MSKSHPVRVNSDNIRAIKAVSKAKGISIHEATDYLVNVAVNRLLALHKDGARRAKGKPATQRRVTVKILKSKKAAKK